MYIYRNVCIHDAHLPHPSCSCSCRFRRGGILCITRPFSEKKLCAGKRAAEQITIIIVVIIYFVYGELTRCPEFSNWKRKRRRVLNTFVVPMYNVISRNAYKRAYAEYAFATCAQLQLRRLLQTRNNNARQRISARRIQIKRPSVININRSVYDRCIYDYAAAAAAAA